MFNRKTISSASIGVVVLGSPAAINQFLVALDPDKKRDPESISWASVEVIINDVLYTLYPKNSESDWVSYWENQKTFLWHEKTVICLDVPAEDKKKIIALCERHNISFADASPEGLFNRIGQTIFAKESSEKENISSPVFTSQFTSPTFFNNPQQAVSKKFVERSDCGTVSLRRPGQSEG
jgi:hypothetical protein